MTTRIVLVGYGRMGAELHRAAPQAGCEVVGVHDLDNPYSTALHEGYDVAIDFTEPTAVLDNVRIAAEHGKNIVIGTTGWYHDMERVHALQERAGIGVLYGSNFSIGVQIFFRLVAQAGRLIDALDEYDPMIHEWHHRLKKDAPSGTALTAAHKLIHELERKTSIATEAQHDRIDPQALHVSSTRGGEIIGKHLLTIDGPSDAIEIQHTAKNRSGFVQGALAAARWMQHRHGFFDFSEVFDEVVRA